MTTLSKTTQDSIATVLMEYNKVNALSIAEVHEVATTITEIGHREDVRVVLLGNRGKGFCVGANVKELNADTSLITQSNHAWYTLFAAIYDCPIPVIAVVDGYCMGGGIGIIGAADIVYASPHSSFSLPEVKVGALGGATHLMRLVGPQKTRSMMYTGDVVSAEEFFRFGGLEAVLDTDAMWDAARALATRIATNDADAVRLAKESLNGIDVVDVKKSYRFEQGFTLELYTSSSAEQARATQVAGGFGGKQGDAKGSAS